MISRGETMKIKFAWIIPITILISLISLLELYFGYMVYKSYKGVYDITIFLPIVFQPLWYKSLFKEKKSNYKIKIIKVCIISICLPLTIYFTLPKYTYDEGKMFVQQYLEPSKNISFADSPFGKCTIPVSNKSKKLFIFNKVYYYNIISTEGTKYFIVDPITGKLSQMSQDFWRGLGREEK
ncbi:MAG: hypothetical protein K0R54_4118 [Clostridiaceae bacterium]|jgi:hypothetical protein|nr:hypothetical protein [Clostridiaceae bacterium]